MEDWQNNAIILNGFFRLVSTSVTFGLVKFFLGLYVSVIFIDVVLLLVQRGFSGDYRETVLGMDIPPELVTKKSKLVKKWNKIKERMASGNESEYKVAIIEADGMIDDLIARMKYAGENMTERLDNINSGQIENIAELRKAHEIRNRIIHDENFVLSKDEAEKTLGYFEDFLRYFLVLE